MILVYIAIVINVAAAFMNLKVQEPALATVNMVVAAVLVLVVYHLSDGSSDDSSSNDDNSSDNGKGPGGNSDNV